MKRFNKEFDIYNKKYVKYIDLYKKKSFDRTFILNELTSLVDVFLSENTNVDLLDFCNEGIKSSCLDVNLPWLEFYIAVGVRKHFTFQEKDHVKSIELAINYLINEYKKAELSLIIELIERVVEFINPEGTENVFKLANSMLSMLNENVDDYQLLVTTRKLISIIPFSTNSISWLNQLEGPAMKFLGKERDRLVQLISKHLAQ